MPVESSQESLVLEDTTDDVAESSSTQTARVSNVPVMECLSDDSL